MFYVSPHPDCAYGSSGMCYGRKALHDPADVCCTSAFGDICEFSFILVLTLSLPLICLFCIINLLACLICRDAQYLVETVTHNTQLQKNTSSFKARSHQNLPWSNVTPKIDLFQLNHCDQWMLQQQQ